MVRAAIGAVILGLVGASCGGGGGGTGNVCVPGMSVACVCTNGTRGAQVCAADGDGYGACVCSSGPGTAGTTGTGGSVVSGTAGTSGAGGSGAGGAAGSSGAGGGSGASGAGGGSGASGAAGTSGTTGAGGRGGAGGATGTGGGVAGASGTTGTGGRGGTGATGGGTGGGVAGASGAAGTGGRGGAGGSAGSGVAGASGTTGGGVAGASGTTGAGGRGGAAGTTSTGGSGGTTGGGGTGGGTATCPGGAIFCEDFEDAPLGSSTPAGWTRSGGTITDWLVSTDGTRVFTQLASTSSTSRYQVATGRGSPPPPWSGPTTVAATVTRWQNGTGAPAALLCVRFKDPGNNYCVALTQFGIQFQTWEGGISYGSQEFQATVPIGAWFRLELSLDSTGTLHAKLDGIEYGTFATTGAVPSGSIAIGTRSTTAKFDNIVVTQP